MTKGSVLTGEMMASFARDGFVIVPGVLEDDAVARYREATLAAIAEADERYADLPGKASFIALDLTHLDPLFVRLFDHEPLVSVFDELLGPFWTLYSFTSTIQPPTERPYTCEIHTDTPRIVPGYLSSALMTIALDDFTEDNGATWYLPGSFERCDAPSEDEFYAGAVRVARRAGDAVVFHPRVWHAGGINGTDRTRVGMTVYGCRHWMKPRFDFPRMLGDDVLEHVGPTGRRVLGFDARVPTSMEEFYRLPEERLFKSGQG